MRAQVMAFANDAADEPLVPRVHEEVTRQEERSPGSMFRELIENRFSAFGKLVPGEQESQAPASFGPRTTAPFGHLSSGSCRGRRDGLDIGARTRRPSGPNAQRQEISDDSQRQSGGLIHSKSILSHPGLGN